MKIGKLDLKNGAILAPMADVTDAPFRQICKQYGAGLTFTQMISARGVVENSFDTLRFLAYNRNEKPIGIQLLGKDPEYLERAIGELKGLNPDVIDLNCGCSVTQVCKFGLGAAMLDDTPQLGRIVKTMVKAAGTIPVSVKIRLGRSRQKINVLDNARAIEDNGASFITVHARTRSDSYVDEPLWEWIARVKESVKIPVVGNGSLFQADDCLEMMRQTNCDSVFIGRGALGNPFIFKRLESLLSTGTDPGMPDIEEVKNTVLNHLDLIIKDSGGEQGVRKARKHIIWYFRFFSGVHNFIDSVFKTENRTALEDLICSHSEKIKNGSYPEEDFEAIKKSFNERVVFWIIGPKNSEFDKQ